MSQLVTAAQVVAIATAVEYVVAMAVYFHAGPNRRGDRTVSLAALAAVAVHIGLCLSPSGDPGLGRSICALAMLAASNALFWSAIRAHGASRPHAVFGGAVPPSLVTRGPYRFVRHPFYLAYLLGFGAAAAVGGHWIQYLTLAALFAVYNAAARGEERLLSSAVDLGPSYAEYLRRSWRWCPPIW